MSVYCMHVYSKQTCMCMHTHIYAHMCIYKDIYEYLYVDMMLNVCVYMYVYVYVEDPTNSFCMYVLCTYEVEKTNFSCLWL